MISFVEVFKINCFKFLALEQVYIFPLLVYFDLDMSLHYNVSRCFISVFNLYLHHFVVFDDTGCHNRFPLWLCLSFRCKHQYKCMLRVLPAQCYRDHVLKQFLLLTELIC